MQKILTACLLLLLVAACKKKEDAAEGTVDKIATMATVLNSAATVYGDTLFASKDSITALNATAQWLLDQPDVDKVYFLSNILLDVHFKNGLQSSFFVVQTDGNGRNLYRGGGGGRELTNFSATNAANTEKIKNNKVLVLNPFVDKMYNGYYPKKPQFEGGSAELDVEVYSGNAVTYSLLRNLDDYGFIILNTHGMANGFFMQKLFEVDFDSLSNHRFTYEEVTGYLNAQGGVPLEKFENGELIFSLKVYIQNYTVSDRIGCYMVTDKFIRNAPLNMDGAVVFGNHCYSGYTKDGPDVNNLPEAWRSKGVSSYYGYSYLSSNSSEPVLEESAQAMEDSLIANLCRYGDSTGTAHLKNNTSVHKVYYDYSRYGYDPVLAVRGGLVFRKYTGPPPLDPDFHLKHFLDDNYAYGDCRDTITDSRDGQQYPTVCIGDQVWMAKNLNWAGAGTCYNNNSSLCNTFGRLYTWAEVMNGAATSSASPSGVQGICPQGWHVPSFAEWQALVTHLGGAAVAGGKLKSTDNIWNQPNTGATNETGFAAMPAGMYHSDDGSYQSGTYWSVMWSTTENTSYPSHYHTLELRDNYAGVYLYENPGTDKLSCRCVKD